MPENGPIGAGNCLLLLRKLAVSHSEKRSEADPSIPHPRDCGRGRENPAYVLQLGIAGLEY